MKKGKDISSASILDNSTTARIASDFQSTWDQLFNIDNNNNNNNNNNSK